jgi:hypothetical protein
MGRYSFAGVTDLAVAVSHPNDLTNELIVRREYVSRKRAHILTTNTYLQTKYQQQ